MLLKLCPEVCILGCFFKAVLCCTSHSWKIDLRRYFCANTITVFKNNSKQKHKIPSDLIWMLVTPQLMLSCKNCVNKSIYVWKNFKSYVHCSVSVNDLQLSTWNKLLNRIYKLCSPNSELAVSLLCKSLQKVWGGRASHFKLWRGLLFIVVNRPVEMVCAGMKEEIENILKGCGLFGRKEDSIDNRYNLIIIQFRELVSC